MICNINHNVTVAWCFSGLLITLFATYGGSCEGGVISVANSSFESPSRFDGAYTTSSAAGTVPSWTINTSGKVVGVWNPQNASYNNASGNGTPSGADGTNVAFFYGTSEGSLTQTLTENLAANTNYTLTVAVGNRNDPGLFAGYQIELLAGGVSVGIESNVSAPSTVGTFADVTLNFVTAGTHSQLGQALGIRLTGPSSGSNTRVEYDNVQLTATAAIVPKPGTAIAMGLLGIVGFTGRRGRRRSATV